MHPEQTSSDPLHPPVIAGSLTGEKGRGIFVTMKKTYSEKLRDPRWQRMRLDVMQRDNFACQDCGDKTKTLAVHHAYYVTGRNPWMYPAWSLSTLCDDCHKSRHDEVIHQVAINDAGEEWNGTGWETSISFMGIRQMSDFDDMLWDIGVEISLHGEFIESQHMDAGDWLMRAVLNQKELDTGGNQP